ncbi:MAG: SDR family NAD(P)-dependent oxidoreductase [Candidatus Tectomicrobia bacterium]|nr:SDR family NAD(P)-dependent oxidoreductase [Candidatus Tectomicrobia bacterium]
MGLLDGKCAVVTGAGRGHGKAYATLLAKEGAKVVVNDPGVNLDGSGFDKRPADETAEEITKAGGTAVINYDTVATWEGGRNIIQTCLDAFGRIDILVNNAGILRDRMVFNMTEEEWDDVITVHLKGVFVCTRHAVVHMRQQQYGRIISVSSPSALGNTGQSNYAAAKAGILGFTRTIARELWKYNITANAIFPGGANSRMNISVPEASRQIRAERGLATPAQAIPEDPNPIIGSQSPPLIAYLASDEASDITGQVLGLGNKRLTLYSHPEPIRAAYKPDGWNLDDMRMLFRTMVGSGVNLTRLTY